MLPKQLPCTVDFNLLKIMQKKGITEFPWFAIDRMLYGTVSGSYAYGTATDESDIDIRAVCLPPIEMALPYRKGARVVGFDSAPTDVFGQQSADHVEYCGHVFDITIYSISTFLNHCCNGSMNQIEMLYTPGELVFRDMPLMQKPTSSGLYLSSRPELTKPSRRGDQKTLRDMRPFFRSKQLLRKTLRMVHSIAPLRDLDGQGVTRRRAKRRPHALRYAMQAVQLAESATVDLLDNAETRRDTDPTSKEFRRLLKTTTDRLEQLCAENPQGFRNEPDHNLIRKCLYNILRGKGKLW